MRLSRQPGVTMKRFLLLSVFVTYAASTFGQSNVDKNVVYGMYSGLALLMDVHRPANANGFAIILIPGSGWESSMASDADPLKEAPAVAALGTPLVAAGYTVFTINHRQAPRFHFPAAVEDAQRAVRYVRHVAARYGVKPDRIGAIGHSSGAHLVEMLATLDGSPLTIGDSVDHESAKVQCVVAISGPSDLTGFHGAEGEPHVTSFMGINLIASNGRPFAGGSTELTAYREASPITHVSPTATPTLLIHGDADPVVPFKQSEAMEQALRAAGARVRLVREAGGGHVWDQTWVGFRSEIIAWFSQQLVMTPSPNQ
jgi:acetyl esterase/lipase